MNIIVFSKNRAAQLELLIRSFNTYVKDFEKYTLKIVYKATEPQYEMGYEKLIKMNYPNAVFIKETNFKQDITNCVDLNKKHLVFLMDDMVFKNPVDFYDEQMKIFEEDKDILCRSLRLHPNLTYSYAMNRPMRRPVFMKNNIFYWRGQDADYGYPMSHDGHIFRTEQIYSYFTDYDFPGPNQQEVAMSTHPLPQPKVICYDKSIVVNNPCNLVQTFNNNYHGNVSISELNENFLNGKLISLENIDGLENTSVHQEIEIRYI